MSNLSNNSFETVNAAATAIVNAQTRLQPSSARKRRWGGCWSLYWCFGSPKHSKRIGHATLVPEPTEAATAVPVIETMNNSSTTVFPFVAPPSSPASFFQSEPPSGIHSPAKLLSLASLSVNACSPGGTASIFTIGPYAYETQLVSPPVFSAFTTEPSTASFTPPPEPAQLTTPSSPEVPFAQLLASSLARTQRNTGPNQKFSSSQYEFQPYRLFPGSPGGYIISPGSTIPNSGTSSPFPDKQPIIKFCMEDISKFVGYEYFSSQKWGSRLGSGSLTPSGLGSRLDSGSLTPYGCVSRLASGSSTPNGLRLMLGSGSLTPTNGEPVIKVTPVESQISELATLASSDKISEDEEIVFGHRVSFELPTEYVSVCLKKDCLLETVTESPGKVTTEGATLNNNISEKAYTCCDCEGCTGPVMPGKAKRDTQEQQYPCEHQTNSLGSRKEFIFDNTKGDASGKPTLGVEWWTSEKVVGKNLVPRTSWTFFPMLQPEIINHGVSKDLCSRICSLSRNHIFNLPAEVKLKAGPSSAVNTYTPHFIASPFFESLRVSGPDFFNSAQSSTEALLNQPNSEFCEILNEYGRNMTRLSRSIIDIVLMCMGDDFQVKFKSEFDNCHGYLRINNYSLHQGVSEKEVEGLGMHTDMSCVTIVYQDEIGGLQVRSKEGHLMDINPCKETLVVNIGDLMQAWSNGKLRSSEHRVVLTQPVNRFSMAFFWCFEDEKEISSPNEVVGEGNLRAYKPFVCADYLRFRQNIEKGKFEKVGFTVKGFAGLVG